MRTHHEATFRASTVSLLAALALTGGLLTACSANASAEPASFATHSHSGSSESARQAEPATAETQLSSAMRTLWDQHMAWTWSTVVAFAEGSPGLDATVARLLANQADIGDAIAPFYGDDAAARLTELLQTHITQAIPVLTAAEAGDTTALNAALDDWYANARDIADFLADANPNWAKGELRKMMKTHITQTTGYAADVLTGDYEAAITAFDGAHAHMAHMADELSAGLIAQFPSRF
ncbi:hypothetical protein [Agromyces humatus]|uniref:Glycosyltransferase n=1 Tax=Agromyces humatus TaxID=279573 RepID=A0ABP4WN78_9MICO|nr:hypothetical protein [Agromyces humatus]